MKKINKQRLNGIFGVTLALLIGLTVNLVGLNDSNAATGGTVTMAMRGEPPVLDHTIRIDQDSQFVLGHLMEGLVREKNGKIVAGIAESWKIDDKKATFKLRKNAVWSNGTPITAKDFVWNVKVTLDPKTASEYSFIMYPIKNAEEINKGKKSADELGAKAIDDYTLEFTFERPTGYFLNLAAFTSYFPINEEFYKAQNGKYAANAENMLFSGPFKLTKWVHGASLKLEKNEKYWNAKDIKLAGIDIPYITPDNNTIFSLFKNNKIDLIAIMGKDDIPNAQKERMKLEKFSDGSTFYALMNMREGRITKNLNLRKAIAAVFNPKEYMDKVVGIPGTPAATGLIPGFMKGVKASFRKEYPRPALKPDVAAAKKYLEAAKKELGLTTMPSIVWLTQDTPLAARESEYFQALLKRTLGIDLKVDKQIFKQRLAKMTSGDFDICSAGWGPDYDDPMTFADLFASFNANNNGKYENAKYDDLVRKAMATSNQKVRMDAMAEAEKIMLDDVGMIPLYERIQMYTIGPKLNGVVRRAIGFDPDLTGASVK